MFGIPPVVRELKGNDLSRLSFAVRYGDGPFYPSVIWVYLTENVDFHGFGFAYPSKMDSKIMLALRVFATLMVALAASHL